MKKFVKRFFLASSILCFCTLIFAISYIFVLYSTANVKFDKTKITDTSLNISIHDTENRPLKHTHLFGEYISLNLLPQHTKDCFISIEDKDFYNHNGINYKRMVSAMAKNIINLKFKEGASTISQQLIKNTHLTSEKTIKRKINEIKLTKKLEQEFSKDQILEYYLNIIYFGDNCYGIQDASEHYFSHSASKLTLDESAMLAGIIKSPNKYHPIKNYDKSIKRRNLILEELKKDGKINDETFSKTISTKTVVKQNALSKQMSPYAKAVVLEASNILKMPEKQIAIGGYRIYTYYNEEKQNSLENCFDKDISLEASLISINVTTGGVEAYTEKSDLSLINVKRQPASAIKPTLVYAPAINENIISPRTEILDDNISINGYSPKNIDEKNYGFVSATTALAKSLNIPAVKILSYVGIENAQNYLKMQNINFNEKDNNLAIALGGFTNGLTLKELTNTYQTLANKGNFISAKFISHILDKNGKVIYKNEPKEKCIYREDTAFLVTQMLKETTKSGTAKKLKSLNFDVASKTGTSSLSKGNIDAYNISYTSDTVVGCWMGKADNSKIDEVGSGAPTNAVKRYLELIYKLTPPKNFTVPSSVTIKEIDTLSLKNEHIVYEAGDYLPERYREKAYFSRFNLPQKNSLNCITLAAPKIEGKIQNGVAKITFLANAYETYYLYEINGKNKNLLQTITSKQGLTEVCVIQQPNKITNYAIECSVKNYKTNTEVLSGLSNIINLYYT